jgi:hypothetical protein
MVRRLPDDEALVLEALRNYVTIPATFHVEVPTDWNKKMPYGVISKVPGGKSQDPRFIGHGLFSAQAVATTRKAASDLAREMLRAMVEARVHSFGNAEGFITHFQVTKEPVPVRDGLVGKHPDSYMFDATYNIWFGVRT